MIRRVPHCLLLLRSACALLPLARSGLGDARAPPHEPARRAPQRLRAPRLRASPLDDEPKTPAPWEGAGADARKAAMAAVFEAQAEMAQADANELSGPELKAREKALYQSRSSLVLGDHFFLGGLLGAALWRLTALKAAESYLLGVLFGGAYLYLLSRYVGSLGETSLEGAKEGGIGQARFAIVALLIGIAGKQRESLDLLPMLGGFFTYQAATLAQAFRPPPEE
eukprot:CAMPEP_0119266070 /NCGR_PEP_ID=MMETSP1329-20130426/4689_1 /TAXON_ID=114041 /ORGANISM="Genus nov. species nov., Strain RCC1024" /LENGTH=224 /DNA_ID=CAMNT_0007265933 /DNA_START=90 /DNA_END=764 /DNA_ORIENTATION=-